MPLKLSDVCYLMVPKFIYLSALDIKCKLPKKKCRRTIEKQENGHNILVPIKLWY